jgi:hypothetical protein
MMSERYRWHVGVTVCLFVGVAVLFVLARSIFGFQ